jgi:membrane protein involved in colicin uptake
MGGGSGAGVFFHGILEGLRLLGFLFLVFLGGGGGQGGELLGAVALDGGGGVEGLGFGEVLAELLVRL